MDAYLPPAAPRGQNPDRSQPIFHLRAVELPFKSAEAGRPVFEERPFVEIIVPGMPKSTAIEPVNDEHKRRWPEQWRAFLDGRELAATGTPLEQWPVMTVGTVANCRALNLKTVEDIANAPDHVLQSMGAGGFEFRKRAQAYLAAAAGGAELEAALKREQILIDKVDVMQGQLDDLASLVREMRAERGESVTVDPAPAKRARAA